MNFDFLKELEGLNKIYGICSNAEKLTRTMPNLSMIASRRSAELLAKVLYMQAYRGKMENMKFADILCDYTFKKYINDRGVINAFHDIRKKGNKAVHEEEFEDDECAMDILRELHYVTGESAKKLGLIKDYPEFDENIKAYQNENLSEEDIKLSEEDINKRAMDMFMEYVAQKEKLEQLEALTQLESDEASFNNSLEGNAVFHEYIEFKKRPLYPIVIDTIIKYINFLVRIANRECDTEMGTYDGSNRVELEITIDSSKYFLNNDNFSDTVIRKLLFANSFSIDIRFTGVLREFFIVSNDKGNEAINLVERDPIWKGAGLYDKMLSFKRREKFVYKLAILYLDSGEEAYYKIENSKECEILDSHDETLISKVFSDDCWTSEDLNLAVYFDFEKYPQILEKLRKALEDFLPDYAEDMRDNFWDYDENQVICADLALKTDTLGDIQDFIDNINKIIEPIKDEVDCGADGYLRLCKNFGLATWEWTYDGFKIKATMY